MMIPVLTSVSTELIVVLNTWSSPGKIVEGKEVSKGLTTSDVITSSLTVSVVTYVVVAAVTVAVEVRTLFVIVVRYVSDVVVGIYTVVASVYCVV